MFIIEGVKSYLYSQDPLDALEKSCTKCKMNLARCEFIVDAEWAKEHMTIHNKLHEQLDNLKGEKLDKAKIVLHRSKKLIEKMEHAKERTLKIFPIREGEPGLFRKTACVKDIEKLISSYLDIKSLLAMRCTTLANKIIVDELVNELVITLNSKKTTPRDLGIRTINELIALLGTECAKVHCLDLRGFELSDSDINEIYSAFTNIEDLFLTTTNKSNCSDPVDFLVDRLSHLRSFSFTGCKATINLPSLHKMPLLENLSLAGSEIHGFPECPSLKNLNLAGCERNKLFEILTCCPNLEELNISKKYEPTFYTIQKRDYAKPLSLDLTGCIQIDALAFLQHCPSLSQLDLTGCNQIKDQAFLNIARILGQHNLQQAFNIANNIQARIKRADVDLTSICNICPSIKTIIAKDLEIDAEDLESVRKKGINVIL